MPFAAFRKFGKGSADPVAGASEPERLCCLSAAAALPVDPTPTKKVAAPEAVLIVRCVGIGGLLAAAAASALVRRITNLMRRGFSSVTDCVFGAAVTKSDHFLTAGFTPVCLSVVDYDGSKTISSVSDISRSDGKARVS
jgi:hypothetical protein